MGLEKIYTLTQLSEALGGNSVRLIRRLVDRGEMAQPFYAGKTPVWKESDWNECIERLSKNRGWEPAAPKASKEQIAASAKAYVGKPPACLAQFASQLMSGYDGTGIYFLLLNEVVIYVGVSVHPMRRIEEHRKGSAGTRRKEFDGAVILPVPLEELLEKELVFINLLNPPENIAGKIL